MGKAHFVHERNGVVLVFLACVECSAQVPASGVGECHTQVKISGACARCGSTNTGDLFLECDTEPERVNPTCAEALSQGRRA